MTPEGHTERPRGQSRSVAKRLRTLSPEMRNAGIAGIALVISMLLPWYGKDYFAIVAGRLQAVHTNLNAFGAFSWVEAAELLVVGGVLVLVWARAYDKAFHLPGGDGTVILAAGCWAVLLLIWRLFDKPSASGAVTFGIQWGFIVAFVAAGAVAAAGARVRNAARPEPPNPAAEEPDWQTPPRRRREDRGRRPHDPSAVTEVLRDPPAWQGEPPPEPRVRRARDASEADTRVDPSEADTRVGRDDPATADTRVDPPSQDRLF